MSILGVRVDALANCLTDVFGFMLQMSQHHNAFVATQATGVYCLPSMNSRILECFCHPGRGRVALQTAQPVPAPAGSPAPQGMSSPLSQPQNMRYSDDELERLNVDSSLQVDANGVRPFIYRGDKEER